MDSFEKRLKSRPLQQPSAEFGRPETLRALFRKGHQRPTLVERIKNMTWQSKLMASAGLAASVIAVSLLIGSLSTGSVAFAQVAEKLRSAQTLTFDSMFKRESDGKVISRSKNYYMVPGRTRVEYDGENGEQSYVVFDTSAGKVLMVDKTHKTAYVSPIKGGRNKDVAAKAIEEVQSLEARATRPLGEKELGGVRVNGFAVDKGNDSTTVWASAATGDPVQIEFRQGDFPDGPAVQVWTNIKLDPPLETSLFGVDAPAGYKVDSFLPVDFDTSPANYTAEFLRIYVKHMEGQFPPKLEEAAPLLAKALRASQANGPPSDEMMKLAFYSAAMRAATRKGIKGDDWQYYPDRKLGGADQIVFWSRDQKNGDYVAVFADLRVEKVGKDQLPPAPAE
jgi:outer membrane lipoprotein-sorting protein